MNVLVGPTGNPDDARAQRLLSKAGNVDTFNAEEVGPFQLNADQLMTLVDPKNAHVLKAIGGVEKLESVLVTNSSTGLTSPQLTGQELENRTRVYGENVLPEKKSQSLWKIIMLTLDDKILIILIIAAIISLSLGLYETFGEPPEYDDDGHPMPKVEWVEGVAILAAVTIVTLVGSINDWNKERQFVKLNRKKEHRMVEVIRDGSQQQIDIESILTGDILLIQPGDVIPVDGVLVHATDVECDESSVTGESDTMKKIAASKIDTTNPKAQDCFVISGSKVLQGTGRFIATGVGLNSIFGRTMVSLQTGTEVTPLQEKLNRIADGIAKFGVWSAIILFTVLFIRFLVQISDGGSLSDLPSSIKGNKFMDIFIVSITIIVVAVPEGLPLAVTLALAFATTRMVKDNCLVRVLKSCETMGGATSICSDKTGTLTQNKMTVVRALLGKSHSELDVDTTNQDAAVDPNQDIPHDFATKSAQGQHTNNLDPDYELLLRDLTCLNATAYEDHNDPLELTGSKTEIALINYGRVHFGLPVGKLQVYRESRNVVYTIPFDSSRKFMLTVVSLGGDRYRMLIKGAAEIVLRKSSKILAGANEIEELDESMSEEYSNTIDKYADGALRCIAIAYKDFSMEKVEWSQVDADSLDYSGMIITGLFGIQDPLRPGVKHAVQQCQRAGVVVRMVTGDNIRTAKAIAINAGIVSPDDDKEQIIMEGPEFREISDSDLEKIASKIVVLARSSPQDKRRLVEFLKKRGETVAVTGDGTNDAPALRLADVGFSMGIAGTEVAKEASDIIIMDDNFLSIVNAIKWGRTVNDSVKKFLQFQLTVNVTAVTLTFVTAVASSDNDSALTAVQLLWVNLIMDTLAALALATDPPADDVLDRPPDNRKKSLITPTMWKMIFGEAIYQLVVTLVLFFAGKSLFFPHVHGPLSSYNKMQLNSMVFNTFVWMQFFNMFVNRRLDNKQNILMGVTKNPYFIAIMAIIGGFQILIMFVGGAAFSIKPITGAMWATSIICGFCSIPVGMIIRLIPDSVVQRIFPKWAWYHFMYALDSVEAAFLWLMTPLTWTVSWITKGIKSLFGSSDDESPAEDERNLLNPDRSSNNNSAEYNWPPGIERSIAELNFLRKVRGGRSKQLNFFKRKNPNNDSRRMSVDSFKSGISNNSTMAAFMAPMIVGGAVGGWLPLPQSSSP
ncbi:calcium-transporting ATPase [Starmerella bacillaris]|uniref:Calcium-transporting ATPase n=1 Tax=Starmerella bacillaris TaxID=1247836 RepID=A0AAV5RIP3_STABA|nr:calcium-transporting ATPase [Starmerella bacillaris]